LGFGVWGLDSLPHVVVLSNMRLEAISPVAKLIEDKAVDPADEAAPRNVAVYLVLLVGLRGLAQACFLFLWGAICFCLHGSVLDASQIELFWLQRGCFRVRLEGFVGVVIQRQQL
jgi:hypothetical protein